ncbi:MAG: YHYH protein [Candidatus Sericytochromatia bacterium]
MTGAYSISVEGSYVVLKSKGRPYLKSIYYKGTEWEDTLYENYTGTDGHFQKNAFVISEYDFIIKIPLNPAVDSNHSTYKGTIGMAVDGVAIFDEYTSTGAVVTEEALGFDQNNSHPTPKNIYHYHLEPTGLTRTLGKDALLGFLLDGFPLYGPEENGKTITNADLDTYHGHFGVTEDYPSGTYHYHVTSEEPFIIGPGYYGKPGMVQR